MGTTLLGQKALSANIEQTVSGNYAQSGTYTRVYIVEADDECNDEYSVLFGTVGLPNINERSDIYPALRVSSRSATEIAPRFWEVTIVWTMPEPPTIGGGGGGSGSKKVGDDWGNGPAAPVRDQVGSGASHDKTGERKDADEAPIDLPPWLRPKRVSYNTIKKPKAATHAYFFGTSENGMPSTTWPTEFLWTKESNKFYPYGSGSSGEIAMISFTNSAGDPFTYNIDRITLQATRESSIRDLDIGTYVKHLGSVNGTPYVLGEITFPPLCVLFSDFSATEEYWTDPETGENLGYWNVRCTYEIDFQTHIIPIPDVGSRYYDFDSIGQNMNLNASTRGQGDRRHPNSRTSDSVHFKDSAGEFFEGALNGKGGKDKDGETNHLFYLPYKIGAW